MHVLSRITRSHDSYFAQKLSLSSGAQSQPHDALLCVEKRERAGLTVSFFMQCQNHLGEYQATSARLKTQ